MKPACEIFNYFNFRINITKALADVEAGKIAPTEIEVGQNFITSYAERVLCLNREERENQSAVGLLMRVDAKRALELPTTVLDKPLFFMNLGRGKGLFAMSGDREKAADILADGNHRLSRAYFDARQTPLKVLMFSREQTKKYMM